MLSTQNISLSFGKQTLFKNVNLNFTPQHCYGIIGANGAGKSSFLKILANQLEPSTGDIIMPPKSRLAILEQDQFKYEDYTVLDTVYFSHRRLYELIKERESLYSKTELTEEEGMKAGEIEAEFGEIGGYEAETEAGVLLNGLGINPKLYNKKMKELESGQKVKVLLAQAIFGNPYVLILDEPTNNLDIKTIKWLEEYLIKFPNIIIVVSHDRHFLNKICTNITDIDFNKIQTYAGNYDFWYQTSQLYQKQIKDENKKKEDKAEELKKFISRFSSNASKAKQATSRKKMLEKISIDQIPRSSRKFPYINFAPKKELGKVVLNVKNLNYTLENETILKDLNLVINQNDKIAFVGEYDLCRTSFFNLIDQPEKADSGEITWGGTATVSYFPKEHNHLFDNNSTILDWLTQYTTIDDEKFVRGFLGRMLFSGEDALKKVSVLSGGEKVRCLLSKLMLSESNVLIMDEPTAHLDLEAITSLNNGLINFKKGTLLFSCQDYTFINSVANRIIEITPKGIIDKYMTYKEYLNDADVIAMQQKLYQQ